MKIADVEHGKIVRAPAGSDPDAQGNHRYLEGEDFCDVCGASRDYIQREGLQCPEQAIERHGPEHRRAMAHDHAAGWAHFDIGTFVESGLLQHINREILWPLGLALSVGVNGNPDSGAKDWAGAYLCLTSTEPPERIESAGIDRRAALDAFVAQRREQLKEEPS